MPRELFIVARDRADLYRYLSQTFADAETMTYETTIDDPAVFTRPWTMRAVEKRKAEYEFWENACHEGERSVEGMLLAK